MSEVDCKTYSVFEIHPWATPKPSLTSRDHLHGRRAVALLPGGRMQWHPPVGTTIAWCTWSRRYLRTVVASIRYM